MPKPVVYITELNSNLRDACNGGRATCLVHLAIPIELQLTCLRKQFGLQLTCLRK